MKLYILIICLLSAGLVLAQEKMIKGRVFAEDASVEGIHVTNLVNEKSVITDAEGFFNLLVSEGDLLVFSALHLDYWRKSVDEQAFKEGYIEVFMTSKVTQLEEVVLTEYPKINAVDLGIVSPDIKRRTPAERRLYTASTGGGILPLDPIINMITGRMKMLKKELEVEKKERLLEKIDYLYEEDFYTETLLIPKELIKGFQFYCVEDSFLVSALEAKNEELVTFLMKELAIEFLDARDD